MRFVRRWIVLAAMALLLGACGFRLAREVVLPGDMRQLQATGIGTMPRRSIRSES